MSEKEIVYAVHFIFDKETKRWGITDVVEELYDIEFLKSMNFKDVHSLRLISIVNSRFAYIFHNYDLAKMALSMVGCSIGVMVEPEKLWFQTIDDYTKMVDTYTAQGKTVPGIEYET